jgi:RNA recognition motif-containing protein
MNIYVGNLSFDASEEEIRQAFTAFGQVSSVSIIKDKFTGESRGFAFVEMPNNTEGQAAINGMNGKELRGRALRVNEARPRESGFGGGGGGNRGGGFGGGGGRQGGPGDRRGGGGGAGQRGKSDRRRSW